MVIAERAGDGYNVPVPYVPETVAGQWRPTNGAPAATPHWGRVTPFGRWSPGDKFRPALPGGYATRNEVLGSKEYAEQVKDVKLYGGTNSTLRTLQETEIGFFWANDLDGTSKPPGKLFTLTSIVS